MLFIDRPENFQENFEVVSCFVEYKEKILLLLRQHHKTQPNTYGVPAGKVNIWEKYNEAMQRELFEETGLKNLTLKYYKKVYVSHDKYSFIYHMFFTQLDEEKEIIINPEEHLSYKRISVEQSLQLNLVEDLDTCIRMFYSGRLTSPTDWQ